MPIEIQMIIVASITSAALAVGAICLLLYLHDAIKKLLDHYSHN